MDSSFYLPVLKTKEGEFTALSNLNAFTRKHICPLFDIGPVEFDNQTGKKPKTLEEHLNNFCHKKFLKKWISSHCFIDTHQLAGQQVNNISCLEFIFSQLASGMLIPIIPAPVMRVKPTADEVDGMKAVIEKYQIEEIGVRVKIGDITAASFSTDIDSMLNQMVFDASRSHLILDLADSDFSQVEDFSDAIVAILDGFPHLGTWKSFTICGGAFPKTNFIQKGENSIPRNDWKFYNEVIRKLAIELYNRPINYGDYGIVSPGFFEFDPLKMSRSANIRYTLNDTWFVLKGSALKKSEDFKQYVDQAKDIIEKEFFLGENFSKGDLHLKNCGTGGTKSGNPTVWNWVGNNHHFTKVVVDLFSSPDDV